MARRRKTPKGKSPEELTAQYAQEADLRAQVDSLYSSTAAFRRSLKAQQPTRILAQRYIEHQAALKPIMHRFTAAIAEVFALNMRVQQQTEDLEHQVETVRAAASRGLPLPADSVRQVSVPDGMPEANSVRFVLELNADTRRAELRDRSPTHSAVESARESLAELTRFADESAAIVDELVEASNDLDSLEEPLRLNYATVLQGIGDDFDRVTEVVGRNTSALKDASESMRTLTGRRDALLKELEELEANFAGS